jgi:hypothetical protein
MPVKFVLVCFSGYSEDLKITFKPSSLKPLNEIKPNLAGMFPFKIVSDSPALHSRWLLLSLMEGGVVGHNIERGPSKNHPSQICFNLVQRFQRRFKCEQLHGNE